MSRDSAFSISQAQAVIMGLKETRHYGRKTMYPDEFIADSWAEERERKLARWDEWDEAYRVAYGRHTEDEDEVELDEEKVRLAEERYQENVRQNAVYGLQLRLPFPPRTDVARRV